VHPQFREEGLGSRHSLRAPMTPAGDASSNTWEMLQSAEQEEAQESGGALWGRRNTAAAFFLFLSRLSSSVDDFFWVQEFLLGPEPIRPQICWAHFGLIFRALRSLLKKKTQACHQNGTPREDGASNVKAHNGNSCHLNTYSCKFPRNNTKQYYST
jgi:hypothetical protein